MAKVTYFIKGVSNPTTIYVRLIDGRNTDLSAPTTLTIDPLNWKVERSRKNTNKTTLKKKIQVGYGWIKQRAEFKEKLNLETDLRKLKDQIYNNRNSAVSCGIILNRDWLVNEINQCFNKKTQDDPNGLVQRVIEYREQLPNKVIQKSNKIGASHYTIANYGTTIKHLKDFEIHKKRTYLLSELDHNFHTEYIKYAQTKLRLAENTIGKDIRQIKTVCLDAKDTGYKVHDFAVSRKFNAPESETIFTTLNESELKTIMQFEGSDYLSNARDWLIIGCWTGCRVSDLMTLSMNNVVITPNGSKLIQYTQCKTGKTVKVPIHPDVETILNARNGFPRPISDQRFNEYIKEVCKRAGLTQRIEGERQNNKTHKKESGMFEKWELIRSHTCRRSFATNHYAKLPNKLIMAVTGHGSERMLLNYIGEVEYDHTDKFFELWNNEKQNQPLKPKFKKIG